MLQGQERKENDVGLMTIRTRVSADVVIESVWDGDYSRTVNHVAVLTVQEMQRYIKKKYSTLGLYFYFLADDSPPPFFFSFPFVASCPLITLPLSPKEP